MIFLLGLILGFVITIMITTYTIESRVNEMKSDLEKIKKKELQKLKENN